MAEAWELGDAEPPAVFAEHTTQQLFRDVDRELHDPAVRRVVETVWLAVEPFQPGGRRPGRIGRSA